MFSLSDASFFDLDNNYNLHVQVFLFQQQFARRPPFDQGYRNPFPVFIDEVRISSN